MHSDTAPIEVMAGNVETVLGVSEEFFAQKGVEGLVVGEMPNPCPWTEVCESSVYLVSSESGSSRWIESRSIDAGDGKFLVSSRTLSVGLLSEDQFAIVTRLCLGGSLMGPLAHELNNVVQGLTSAEYLIRDSLECGESVEMEDVDQLTLTLTALKQMGAAIQGFARTAGFEVQPVDFSSTLTRVTSFLNALGKLKTVDFKVDVPGDLPDLFWNQGYMELILQALLCNAAEATQATNEDSPRVTLSAACTGSQLEIRVCNTAGVFSLRDYQAPGMSTRPRHRHAGLGLSAVVQIVRECGGTISSTEHDNLPGVLLILPVDTRESL